VDIPLLDPADRLRPRKQKEPIPDASSYARCRGGSLLDASTTPLRGEDRYTVKQPNKDSLPRDSRLRRVARYLREWRESQGRTVRDQMIRGVSYGVGSGAVSLLVVWFEARH